MLPPNIFQANIVGGEGIDLRPEIAAQKAHQEIDFCFRTLLPVFLGEGVQRERRNSDARCGLASGTHGGHAGAMSGNARHVPTPGPAPVSVHDDGDMLGKTRRIKAQINVSFLPFHPSRNRVSQAELSESKLTHEIQCVQCDGEHTCTTPKGNFYRASSGNIARISLSVCRMTVKAQRAPTCASVSRRCRSSTPATGLSSSATITSPSRKPAARAGLRSSIPTTTTPVSHARE